MGRRRGGAEEGDSSIRLTPPAGTVEEAATAAALVLSLLLHRRRHPPRGPRRRQRWRGQLSRSVVDESSTRSAASGHNTHSEDSGGRWTPTRRTADDGRTAQTRETDERSRPNQVRPGVRPSPVRSRRPFVWRSYEQRGRGGGRGADAASAVTTAMVTVWNAALLPPRLASLPLRPRVRRWTIIRCAVFLRP